MNEQYEKIRQEEAEYFLSLIIDICYKFNFAFCATIKNKKPYLKLIDNETKKEYYMVEDHIEKNGHK